MKLKDFIEICADDCCFDIQNNYSKHSICYCGEKLTDSGKKKFRKALSFDIKSISNNVVIIDVLQQSLSDEDAEKNLIAVYFLFESMNGFCNASEYTKWFTCNQSSC